MEEIKVGDVVARKSYSYDICFRIVAIEDQGGKKKALLRGLFVRLYADAPINDLVKKNSSEITAMRRSFMKMRSAFLKRALNNQNQMRKNLVRTKNKKEEDYSELPGWVLHIDGDREYRDLCLRTYLQLGIPAQVLYIPEKDQPQMINNLLKEYHPDILVLTGHDGIIKKDSNYRDMESYRHSQSFLEAINKSREYEPDRDALVVIAGGCQSYYEKLIEAGANFASSPERVMIHVLDPVFIAEKIAYTSIYEKLYLPNILDDTVTGSKGIGGIQTKGKLRLGLPRFRY